MTMTVGISNVAALARMATNVASIGAQKATMRIATNSEVVGPAWDGARYAQKLALETQKVEWESRIDTLNMVEIDLKMVDTVAAQNSALMEDFRALVLQARTLPAGGEARARIQAAWNATVEQSLAAPIARTETFPNAPVVNLGQLGIQLDQNDPFFNGWLVNVQPDLEGLSTWADAPANAGLGRPIQFSTFDILNASDADLDDARTTIDTMSGLQGAGLGWAAGWQQFIGHDLNTVDRKRDFSAAMLDRLDAGISSLVDTDLAAESARLAAAQAREQLAITAMNIANGTTRTALNLFV